jgi:hypothetical protein
VPVDDQPDQPIPVTMAIALERGQQLVYFSLGQVLPDPVGLVPLASFRSTGRITNVLECRSRTILPYISAPPLLD